MRRVVVTGMGIVSSIGNNANEVVASLREARSGIVKADKYAELGFRSQVHGMPTLDAVQGRRPPRHALSRRRHRLEPCRHGAGDRRLRPWRRRSLQRAHRHHHGLGRPLRQSHRRLRRSRPAPRGQSASAPSPCPRPCPRRPRRRSPSGSRSRASIIRSPRPARPRTTASATPMSMIQWGKQDIDVRRRLRGARMGALGAVRRHGRHVLVL